MIKGRSHHASGYLPYLQYLEHLRTRLPAPKEHENFEAPYLGERNVLRNVLGLGVRGMRREKGRLSGLGGKKEAGDKAVWVKRKEGRVGNGRMSQVRGKVRVDAEGGER